MWRSWAKSSPKKSDKFDTSSSPSSIFRCSSFKDIETLCLDPDFHPTANHHSQPEQPPLKHHHHHQQQQPPPSTPRRSVFHRVRTANALLRQWPGRSESPKSEPNPEEGRIVVYCTSLRVVRPTFEACKAVQSVLQGFRVTIEERDVAMDMGFMSELRERLGRKSSADEKVTLPRVFIGGRYVGGAEEVLQLHEIGELKKLVQGLPAAAPGTCEACGGYRFILCGECSGSHKIFSEKNGLRSCTACNENGLIRCPRCCSSSSTRRMLPQRNGY